MYPTLTKATMRRLHNINPYFYAKWDRGRGQWEVGFDNTIDKPYIISYITHPITERSLEALRKAVWISSHGVKRWAIDEYDKFKARREREDERLKDRCEDFGKQANPLLRSFDDARGGSHGNSRFMFPGIGESTIHGGEGDAS